MLLKYYVLTPSIIYYRATPKFRRPKELPECNLDCYREEQQRAKQQEACEEYQKFMMECCPNRCPDPMVIEPLDPENPIAVELPYLKISILLESKISIANFKSNIFFCLGKKRHPNANSFGASFHVVRTLSLAFLTPTITRLPRRNCENSVIKPTFHVVQICHCILAEVPYNIPG